MRVRILLCDDEAIQRSALRLSITRLTDLPMSIDEVKEAVHGRQALDLMESFRPDIVFLDLRMPVMGGLEAAKLMIDQHPLAQVVILTAYDEFNFAQEAIKVGVKDYLLKPASEADLHRVLKKVMCEILDRQEKERVLESMKKRLEEARPYIQLEYISDLLNGTWVDQAVIDQKRDFLGLDMHPEIVMLLELDDFDRFNKSKSETERQLLKEQVRLIIKQETRSFPALISRLGGERLAILLNSPMHGITDRERTVWATSVAERIRIRINQGTGQSVTIGLGRGYDQPAGLHQSNQDAQKALRYKFILGCNHTIQIDDVDVGQVRPSEYPYDLENRVTEAMRLGDESLTQSLLRELVNSFCLGGIEQPEKVRWRLLELFVVLARAAAEGGAEPDELSECNLRYLEGLLSADTLSQMQAIVLQAGDQLLELVQSVRNMRHQRLIKRAKEYMQDHFREPLSLEDLARVVYLSPFYFSHIFKEEMNMTFIEYLTNLRISEAKRLLRDTLLAVGTIAEQVGYNDINYFSRVFKKVVGMTPSQFRDKNARLTEI